MLDKMKISERFFSCYSGKLRREIGLLFGVRQGVVSEWATEGTVPWSKLKYLSDSQAVSWDWLLEGVEPKESLKVAIVPDSCSPEFDNEEITKRFLSLFEHMKQKQIAALLKVATSTVSNWKRNKKKVAWERLADAVDTFSVRWDWLIDGLEPKHNG